MQQRIAITTAASCDQHQPFVRSAERGTGRRSSDARSRPGEVPTVPRPGSHPWGQVVSRDHIQHLGNTIYQAANVIVLQSAVNAALRPDGGNAHRHTTKSLTA